MFRSARIKLTGWYLFIIMLISVFFSLVIYVGMVRELERGFRRTELRLRAEELGVFLPRRFSDRPEDLPRRLREARLPFLFTEDLKAAKRRLAVNLIIVNGAILVISAGAGYFLAGKTLGPIEKAMEEQKRFIADASHEFRTPLTALKTSMEVALRERKLPAGKAKKVIKSSLEDVNSLQSLSNNLLNLASLQANGANFNFGRVDIFQVVGRACRKVSPLAREKKVEIKNKVKKQIIEGDKERLEEMMIIFLDNAVKYNFEKGKVVIKGKRDRNQLVLEIQDTGVGIAEKDIAYIFERFYRADQSRSKDKRAGFGLGLSLAKRIIEIHKGSVKVKSRLGKGTTFIIRLPIRRS